MSRPARAVVFANHDVGVRCLAALLGGGVDVALVVAHDEEPAETLRFASVIEAAMTQGLDVAVPDDVNDPTVESRIARIAPDFIFSFYCRQMIGPRILNAARSGALNMHGALLPAYRGRAPVNWAVIRGETETGATLHYMTEKADAGDIVAQERVPIFPDDTAFDVFRKVTFAAEIALWRAMPGLIAGNAPRIRQDASAASYFGRRRPEDGRIDWSAGAKQVHDLVRGVAPPYPGAFTIIHGHKLRILRTSREKNRTHRGASPTLQVENDACFIGCRGGGVLRVVEADIDGVPVAPGAIDRELGFDAVYLLDAT